MAVYAIGETVLDIIFKNNRPVSAKPGGSVLNTSVSLGRLGIPVKFVSDYGRDKVGDMIDSFLYKNNVSTEFTDRFENGKSALAMAFLDEKNDASYTFYKDFPEKRLENISIGFSSEDYLIFGSFFAIADSVRNSLRKLLLKAKNAGTTIIYDPNFRRSHLHELENVKPWIIENIGFADLVKGSDEDFNLVFKATNPAEAFTKVRESGCNILFYTSGSNPLAILTDNLQFELAIPKINPVSTIGAGDNFNAGILYSLITSGLSRIQFPELSKTQWREIGETAISFSENVCLSYENYISNEFADEIIARNQDGKN